MTKLISQTEFETILKNKAEAEKAHLEKRQTNYFIANRDIHYVLELWGAYNRSGLDRLGYRSVSSGFLQSIKKHKSVTMCSEDDAIILDSILLRLSNSQSSEKRAMSKIIMSYYIGIDSDECFAPVPCKSIKMISQLIGYGETKTAKLKEAAENYICGSLDALNKVLDCELGCH